MPNRRKTILGAFWGVYRYVMDMRSREQGREQERNKRRTESAQKENDNLCSLPIEV